MVKKKAADGLEGNTCVTCEKSTNKKILQAKSSYIL